MIQGIYGDIRRYTAKNSDGSFERREISRYARARARATSCSRRMTSRVKFEAAIDLSARS